MVKPKRDLNDEICGEANRAPRGVWLVVFPASGTVRRLSGRFFAFDLGGESGVAPFVFLDGDRQVMSLDPRVLVVNDKTLVPVWHPRKHLHHSHAMAGQWYGANPDVFQPDVENGTSLLAEL